MRRLLTLTMAAALLGGGLDLTARSVRAQTRSRSYVPNTYADFPYNQGSLFYRPLGANARTRKRAVSPRPRPLRYYSPAPQGNFYYYVVPQPVPPTVIYPRAR